MLDTAIFGINTISGYIAACVIIVLLPGPNSMLCMSIAAQYGYHNARFAIFGTLVGNGSLITLSAFGLGAALRLYPALFSGLKLLGAAYLAYLGIYLLKSAYQQYKSAAHHLNSQNSNTWQPSSPSSTPTKKHLFTKALMVALLNPKGLLFFPAMMVQFLDNQYHTPILSFIIMMVIFQSISLLFLNLLAPISWQLARLCQRHIKVVSTAKASVGTLFVLFASKIWSMPLI